MLRSGDQDEIVKMFKQLQNDARHLLKQVVSLAFYMRGGIQYSDLLLNRTRAEREVMEDFLGENIRNQKGSTHLVY